MTRAEILERIEGIARDIFEDDVLELTEGSAAEDVDEWDSVNHVRLMIAVESEFGIRFETEEINEPRDVGGLISLIEEKLGRSDVL